MPRPPKEGSRRNNPDFSPVTAKIPNVLGKRLRVFVTQEETTISEVVEEALEEYLDKRQVQLLPSAPETIAELVQQNFYHLLTDGKITSENLKVIADGENPSNAELVRIAQILDLKEEDLLAMRERTFSKGRDS